MQKYSDVFGLAETGHPSSAIASRFIRLWIFVESRATLTELNSDAPQVKFAEELSDNDQIVRGKLSGNLLRSSMGSSLHAVEICLAPSCLLCAGNAIAILNEMEVRI